MVQPVEALASGMYRAERHWFELRSIRDFLSITFTLYVLYEIYLIVSISPAHRYSTLEAEYNEEIK